jgi:uncharacterized protein YkwD
MTLILHPTSPQRHKPKPKPKSKPKSKPKPQAPAATPTSTATAIVACADTQIVPTWANLDRVAVATLCLVNQQRAAAGLAPVHPVASMTSAAIAHSVDMVAVNYVAQTSPSGDSPLTRLTKSGYVRPNTAVDIGENIAGEIGTAAITPAATVAAWMTSPDSRALILTAAYTDSGIGVVAVAPATLGSGPGATYTEDFGATS